MQRAAEVIARCWRLALCTEEPGHITRTFLSPPMHEVHTLVRGWMEEAGLRVSIDAAGNIRGVREGPAGAPRLYIGSHLDTVPHAGAFDGILGVMLGIALAGKRRFDIEVVGFSEEEGVRFGVPFIGSRALAGDVEEGPLARTDVREAIRDFGLDPSGLPYARAAANAIGYVEFHIEQGPVLEHQGEPLAVVDSIAGLSRFAITFHGAANHSGTTPMHLRRDAVAAAAEWIVEVERIARSTLGLVATVGRMEVYPGAANVIAGEVRVSLDVRHAADAVRRAAVDQMLAGALRRGLKVSVEAQLDQPSVAMSPRLCSFFPTALPRLTSGAGHDAMILARRMPAAMLFLRSPGGISHHPDETVLEEDVAAALEAGAHFLDELEAAHG